MSSDLEARLQRQLAARADAVPQSDRLESVVAKGRRRQLRSRVALSMAGLVLIGGGFTTFAVNNRNQSTFTVSENPADGSAVEQDGTPRENEDDPESTGTTVLQVPAPDGSQEDGGGNADDGNTGDGNTGDGNANDADGDEAADAAEPESETDGNDEDASPEGSGDGELIEIADFSYAGAFRLSSETFGSSDTNYAVGPLAFNPTNNSLFVAGHPRDNAIAEFDIPTLGSGNGLAGLPVVNEPRQPFSTIFDRVDNPELIDRVTGMYVAGGSLLVNAERVFDSGGDADDTTLVLQDAAAIDSGISGFYQLNGRAMAGGYMSPVPEEWQPQVGGSALTGWASNYGIISRYSLGPTLYGFSPEAVVTSQPGPIATDEHMTFPFAAGDYLSPDALTEAEGSVSQTWNLLSRGVYGFIVPGSRTFAVVGSNGGAASGIGVGITQDDGSFCTGPCSYKVDDNYNYYWLFDLDEILLAGDSAEPRPYAHGRWDVPFDDGGEHLIVGATLDAERGVLYMSLAEAGQVGAYDRPPVIVAYKVS